MKKIVKWLFGTRTKQLDIPVVSGCLSFKEKIEQEYTQEEILKNMKLFQDKEDDLINQRKEINKTIHHIKKQREY